MIGGGREIQRSARNKNKNKNLKLKKLKSRKTKKTKQTTRYEVSKLLMMTAATTKNDGRTDGRDEDETRDDANANYYNFINP